MARALGTDDSVTTCDCCGKVNLKFTVAIELDCGDVVHYGQVCASRNTGKTRPVINAEIKVETQRVLNLARSEYRACAERIAYDAKLAERNARRDILPGIAAMEYVKAESIADDKARSLIAAKHGLHSSQLL